MRVLFHWLFGLAVLAGMGVIGYQNPAVGVVLLFGGAAGWLATQKGASAAIRRYVGLGWLKGTQKARQREARDQFSKLNMAEHEAIHLIFIHGSILPAKVRDHLAKEGFADPEKVIDSIRAKTSFLEGSFSGEFSLNPSMKDLLEELIEEPLLANSVTGYIGLGVGVLLVLVVGYLFYSRVYPGKPKLPIIANGSPSELRSPISPNQKASSFATGDNPKKTSDNTARKKDVTKKAPSVSSAGPKSQSIGSITQEAGSALSFNQQGGITAGTVNNFGSPVLPTPTVKVCVAYPDVTAGENFESVITLTTSSQLPRPFFALFFDGPVLDGSAERPKGSYGYTHMRAEKLPNPERSFVFRTIAMELGGTSTWFPSDGPIQATVPSKSRVNLIRVLGGGGDDPDVIFNVNLVFSCS